MKRFVTNTVTFSCLRDLEITSYNNDLMQVDREIPENIIQLFCAPVVASVAYIWSQPPGWRRRVVALSNINCASLAFSEDSLSTSGTSSTAYSFGLHRGG